MRIQGNSKTLGENNTFIRTQVYYCTENGFALVKFGCVFLCKSSTCSLDYDVYPYATFTVPTQLQTFRDCKDGNMMSDNMHSLQRKLRNSSKNLHDTMSLGKVNFIESIL